ncbi:hypothetical protein [Polaromonas sp.]|uniref:hypothetical protein n=1 Tax=Polaromonas sp. TaxID=1869339 RepID=UPI003264B761
MSAARVLTRNMRVGESITFDNGRIVARLEERTGRNTARIRFELEVDVVVTKPSDPIKPKDTLPVL